ncbi:Transposon Tf2-6 polyprotein [Pseudoloma neurophilia]|uniref:Transposon Tf2-6 polyprotein n=1 Tax=Pseudoloma neurophilia TaxID=146866 RepID=A0A0R0M2Y1_9MICR|nr:Transposon Tf2-6 polyprotein [Pseudoloma neurophilia]
MKRLSEKNININGNKIAIGLNKIKYLGFEVSADGYAMDPERLENFKIWKRPKTKRQCQILLGKINWYRPFLKNLSQKLKPFNEKLRGKKRRIIVTDEEMKILSEIYEEIKLGITLYFPDLNTEFYLNTDAAENGVGAILYQQNGIVGYFSKALNDSQKKYSVHEKECLAVLWAIEHWNSWVGGSKIIINTDNKNLISNTGNLNKMVERWKAKINRFNVEFRHISGEENSIADELSRKINKMSIITSEQEREWNEFHVIHGHPGQEATIKTLKQSGKLLRGQIKRIKLMIKNCEWCQMNKTTISKLGIVQGIIGTTVPFQKISSDIYGPFEKSEFIDDFEMEKDKLYILTISDRATRLSRVWFIEHQDCKTITNHLKLWIDEFGKPEELLTDNGTCYIGEHTKDYLMRHGIKQRLATPENPTGNSISERINQTITTILRIYKHWKLSVIKEVIENRLNKVYHSRIKEIPTNIVKKFGEDSSVRVNETQSSKDYEKMNKGRKEHKYKIGDKILRLVKVRTKIETPYRGPFIIREISVDGQVFVIETDEGKMEKVNVKNIKPFWERKVSCDDGHHDTMTSSFVYKQNQMNPSEILRINHKQDNRNDQSPKA